MPPRAATPKEGSQGGRSEDAPPFFSPSFDALVSVVEYRAVVVGRVRGVLGFALLWGCFGVVLGAGEAYKGEVMRSALKLSFLPVLSHLEPILDAESVGGALNPSTYTR